MVKVNPEDYDDWKQRLNGAHVRKPLVETAIAITEDDEAYNQTVDSMLEDLDGVIDALQDRVSYTGQPDVVRAQLARFVSEPLARRYEQSNPPDSLDGLVESVHQVIKTAPNLEDPDWTDLDESTTRSLTLSRATTRLGPIVAPHADHTSNRLLLLNDHDGPEVLSALCDDIHNRATGCTEAIVGEDPEADVVTTVYQSMARTFSESYEHILDYEANRMVREFQSYDENQQTEYQDRLSNNPDWIPLVKRAQKTIDTIQTDTIERIVPGSIQPDSDHDLGGHFKQEEVRPAGESVDPQPPF